jgi:hypothetical protein
MASRLGDSALVMGAPRGRHGERYGVRVFSHLVYGCPAVGWMNHAPLWNPGAG